MLASAAGLTVAKQEPDCTGIDFQMSTTYEDGFDGGFDFARLEAQVKSWSAPTGRDGFWRYRGLTEKRFNALAGARRVPRYLFVVIVPPDTNGYAHAEPELLALRHAAYWVSLRDVNRFPEPRHDRKVQVMVPQQNLLTTESLAKLCG